MKLTAYRDGTLITLSSPLGSRDKILNLFYFIVLFSFAGIFIKMAIRNTGVIEGQILCTVFGLASLIASFRFANKTMTTEELFVNAKEFQIIKRAFLVQKQVFELSSITHFRHLEKPETARHPLAGESFDYLGFQTQQQMINEMYGDNRLAFDYNGKTVSFGQNVYSWEFDEISGVLKECGYIGD
jgi:hypothetical protein